MQPNVVTYKSQAIVLKSYDWPRNARLYVLYTRKYGKVQAVAAGSQKIKSKVAGHLQPFCLTEVMFAKGRSIDKLAQARLVERFHSFSQDWSLFMLGSYIVEVVASLTKEGVADRKIWEALLAVYKELNEQGNWLQGLSEPTSQKRLKWISRVFAWQVLQRLGFSPQLNDCIHCRGELNQTSLSFSLLQGGVVCSKCEQNYPDRIAIDVDTIKLIRFALSSSLPRASRLAASPEVLKSATDLIDQLISVQIQRPLNNAIFLRSIQNEPFLL